MRFFLFLILLLQINFLSKAYSQNLLHNLGFEYFNDDGEPLIWYFNRNHKSFTVTCDTINKFSGKASLFIKANNPCGSAISIYHLLGAALIKASKKISFECYVKFEGENNEPKIFFTEISGKFMASIIK